MPLAVDVMLDQLVRDNFTFIFGNPGTFEEALLDRLVHFPSIQYILGLQESAVVAMAMGYSRASKQTAFVQLHGAVGLGNAMGMLLEAKQAKLPMVVYVGENTQYDEAFQGFLAYDLVGLGSPACKATVRATVPEQVARQLRRAIQIASTAPYGPVLFAVPMDVLEAEVDQQYEAVTKVSMCSADISTLGRATTYLREAKTPLIVVGDGVAWAGAQQAVQKLSNLIAAPVYGLSWTMCNAECDDPLFREVLTHSMGKGNAQILRSADVLLLVGAPLAWEVMPDRGGYVGPGATLIQIDSDPAALGMNFHAEIAILGDILENITALAALVKSEMLGDDVSSVERRVAALGQEKELERGNRELKWQENASNCLNHPFAMLKAAKDYIGSDTLIFEEAMTAQPFLRHFLTPRRPNLYYPALSRTLGAGLPGAIGAKLARPDTAVVGFSADGAAMYVPQALWTACHYNLDMLFIILNNASYRVLKLNLNEFRSRMGEAGASFPFMDIVSPEISFSQLGQSMGLLTEMADSPESVRICLEKLSRAKGPKLLEMRLSGAVDL